MFIKIPVYFDVRGSFHNLGLIQEGLHLWLEQELFGRKTKVPVDLAWEKFIPSEEGIVEKVLMIKKKLVIDGLK
jgi:hypothetical protein